MLHVFNIFVWHENTQNSSILLLSLLLTHMPAFSHKVAHTSTWENVLVSGCVKMNVDRMERRIQFEIVAKREIYLVCKTLEMLLKFCEA